MFVGKFLPIAFAAILFGIALPCQRMPGSCFSDKDCKAGTANINKHTDYFCINRLCVQCRKNSDCSNIQWCELNSCRDKTCADINCLKDQRCHPSTLECVYICAVNGERPCDDDICKICFSHQCISNPSECSINSDCKTGYICKSDKCKTKRCILAKYQNTLSSNILHKVQLPAK